MGWYKGKGDWLFLGNEFQDSVAKLKLAKVPSEAEVNSVFMEFNNIAEASEKCRSQVALLVGPDKPSVYPEFLPDEFVPSSKRYLDFFLDKLKTIPQIKIYDPTKDLISQKQTNGLLYWMTDSHWNNRGAFLAYAGLLEVLGLPKPEVSFRQGETYSGDLIKFSNQKNFPLHREDNWEVIWKSDPKWTETRSSVGRSETFGVESVVVNEKPKVDKYVWVVGDSYTRALRQYINATFREVRYVGEWGAKKATVPKELAEAAIKPDFVLIVKVERTF